MAVEDLKQSNVRIQHSEASFCEDVSLVEFMYLPLNRTLDVAYEGSLGLCLL